MEEEDYIIATWAQEDVETLYNPLNKNITYQNPKSNFALLRQFMPYQQSVAKVQPGAQFYELRIAIAC